jgi:hypothetical protein
MTSRANKIINWLASPNKEVEGDPYKDPGYSGYYRSLFGHPHQYGDDIDLSISSNNYYQNIVEEQWMEKDTITKTKFAIPPGTNHSNANALYKIISNRISNENFSLPNITKGVKYNGSYIDRKMKINKKKLYGFIYDNSDTK